MHKFLVDYSTKEGETAKIAEHITQQIQSNGYGIDIIDTQQAGSEFCLEVYKCVLIGASVNMGQYPQQVANLSTAINPKSIRFLRAFSVSLPDPAEGAQLDLILGIFLIRLGGIL